MQKLCNKSGCGVCIGCDNPNDLLCRNEVEVIVECLRFIVSEFVTVEEVKYYLDMSNEEVKKLLNIK
jgi:hypothetical protein